MSVPDWVQDAVFYQIFPDRFANGDPSLDPPNVQPWGSPPTVWGFQGGDLRGVIDRFGYLLDLGINAIYFNPIFQATSNHRYNTTDYFQIDSRLGDVRVFKSLLDLAHRSHVRVILDGVFNHCGRGFFAFNDLLENEEHSPYRDWFHVNSFPLDAYGPGKAKNYLAWWGMRGLPKLNTATSATRRYLLEVARHWIDQGADGWRLDVPNEIDDDSFWQEFRDTVKAANPEAYLVGEIWEADPRWVGPGHFDGLMNYPLREAILDFVARKKTTGSGFAKSISALLDLYPREHAYSHYLPLGTHDTERILTLCGHDRAKVRLAFLILFSYPGAPGIYYGDEIGTEGGKDPDSRRAFPWNRARWDEDTHRFVKKLVGLRHRLAPLRRGNFQILATDDATNCVVIGRRHGEDSVAVAINASARPRRVRVPVAPLGWGDGVPVSDALSGGRAVVRAGAIEVRLDAHGGALFHLSP